LASVYNNTPTSPLTYRKTIADVHGPPEKPDFDLIIQAAYRALFLHVVKLAQVISRIRKYVAFSTPGALATSNSLQVRRL
jgi:hypothetical protein